MKRKKKKRKGVESIGNFMSRRNKETGKVTIPQYKTPLDSAGSHTQKARMLHKGVVKPATARKLERIEKAKKRKAMTETTP
jgi:hypothetical protein